MANYSEFEYGTNVVYGQSAPSSVIDSIDMISETVIRVAFNGAVVVDENLLDINNYVIEYADDLGNTDVFVRRIRPSIAGSIVDVDLEVLQLLDTSTSVIEIVTDVHSKGVTYKITISDLVSVDGTVIADTSAEATGRLTKTDSVLRNLPAHFDKRPESLIRSILTAISIEDDRIGGSLSEEVP